MINDVWIHNEAVSFVLKSGDSGDYYLLPKNGSTNYRETSIYHNKSCINSTWLSDLEYNFPIATPRGASAYRNPVEHPVPCKLFLNHIFMKLELQI